MMQQMGPCLKSSSDIGSSPGGIEHCLVERRRNQEIDSVSGKSAVIGAEPKEGFHAETVRRRDLLGLQRGLRH